MKKIIHHLRRQPEATRHHILHMFMVVCAVILLAFWVYSLTTNFTKAEVVTEAKNDLQPLSALKGNLIGGYQNITDENSETQQ